MHFEMPLICKTDSYKFSHKWQYPPKTEEVSAYLEARTGARFPYTVFFGLQYILREHFSKKMTMEDIVEAQSYIEPHGFKFPREDWETILNDYKGFIPISIEAVPEGSVVPINNVLMQVRSIDPRFYWLTTYFEPLLMHVWSATTVATKSYFLRQEIYRYLAETCDDPDSQIGFKLHDFGYRGATCHEQAALCGAGHLINFLGSDTMAAIGLCRRVYGEQMAGFSIPAAEHSTITAWGKNGIWHDKWTGGEDFAYENMITQFGDKGMMFAVVSDSYDIKNAVDNIWGIRLKNRVLNSKGTLVIRPDSGNPNIIVPEILKSLATSYGSRVNSKGYHVLNDKVRVIQGDGMNEETLIDLLEHVKNAGFSTENIACGMGGGLLQNMTRDTQRFAMKASAIRNDGTWFDVFKEPKSDLTKTSKRGRLALVKDNGVYKTVRIEELGNRTNLLRKVWTAGEWHVWDTFENIRARALKMGQE